MFNMWILLLSKTMLAYELLICILFFRFVKTILITKLITDIDLKAHGQFPHQIMVVCIGLYCRGTSGEDILIQMSTLNIQNQTNLLWPYHLTKLNPKHTCRPCLDTQYPKYLSSSVSVVHQVHHMGELETIHFFLESIITDKLIHQH